MLLLFLGISLVCCKAKQKERPENANGPDKKNVLFILVDDLGWKDLGCYGSEFYETPNIDRLASKSTIFTSAYTPNPVCSPTRAAILTGKYPTRVGITDWIPGHVIKDRPLKSVEDYNQLPLEETTIAEVLKEADYNTFFAGKWHLGDTGFFPEDQGFDINMGGHHMGQPPGGYYAPYNNPKLSDGPNGEYLTDRLTDESLQFLEENRNNPFFLYLAYYTVHTPIEASKKHLAKFTEKKKNLKDTMAITIPEGAGHTVINQYNEEYASMVYALDENVGRLLDKLDALGLTDDTLIVFTSDNGGLSTTESDWIPPTSVRPLRAGKGWAYEGGIRVPLIIKSPGLDYPTSSNAKVMSMDLFPTILEALGLKKRPDLHVDGESLYPLIMNERDEVHDVLFWDYPHYHTSGWTPGQAIREGDWKLIHFYEDDVYELYNLKEDIGEKENLAATHPEELAALKSALNAMNTRLDAKQPEKNVDVVR